MQEYLENGHNDSNKWYKKGYGYKMQSDNLKTGDIYPCNKASK